MALGTIHQLRPRDELAGNIPPYKPWGWKMASSNQRSAKTAAQRAAESFKIADIVRLKGSKDPQDQGVVIAVDLRRGRLSVRFGRGGTTPCNPSAYELVLRP